MRWGKIIPIVLLSVLILAGVAYAWQGLVSLNVLVPDMPHTINANISVNPNTTDFSAIRIYLEPLVPLSYSVEGLARCQQKALKSA
jgi:hypothetical protein